MGRTWDDPAALQVRLPASGPIARTGQWSLAAQQADNVPLRSWLRPHRRNYGGRQPADHVPDDEEVGAKAKQLLDRMMRPARS